MTDLRYFWVSFSGDEGFRGACIVAADCFDSALRYTHRIGINPGGAVQSMELEDANAQNVAPYELNRLYSKAEMEALGGSERF